MAINELPPHDDPDEEDYEVEYLDGDTGVRAEAGDIPLAAVAPSYLVFDTRRQLTFWSIRPEDDCADFERLLYPGLGLEDLVEKAVRVGVLEIGAAELRQYVDRRLIRFASGDSSFQVRMAGDRWFRVGDRRAEDGTTLTTITNVTDVERRERALEMLLGEHLEGLPVFERAARALATGLGFHTAFVARLTSDNAAEIIACVHDQHEAPSKKFTIRGTPCEPVYRKGYFAFSGDFFKRFPQINLEAYFAEVGHGSYVGQVIYDREGNPVGHVLALDENLRIFDDGDHRFIRLVGEHVGYEMERLANNSALESEEQRFRDFAETASDLFFETDARLRCIFASDHAGEVTGLALDDWRGRSIRELGSRDDAGWQSCLEHMAEHTPFKNVVFPVTGRYGGKGSLSLSGKPIFDTLNRFTGFRLTARQLSVDTVAEGRAREAELRLQQVLETSLEGFALYDAEHRLVLCNDRFRTHLFRGNDAAVTPGMTLKQLSKLWLKSSSTADKRRLMNFHLEPDALGSDYLDIIVQDKGTLRVIRRRTEDGGVATVYLDITDLKHREHELSEAKELAENANSTKSRFLANVSHELRTPLNAIIGFADIMRQQLLGPLTNPRYREYVNDIRASGEHLLDMINDILDLSKAEAGQLELTPEIVDVAEVVHSVVRLMHERAESAQINLIALLQDNLPALTADKKRLKQVLINLLSNAIKFTPVGGEIEVIGESLDGNVSIVIDDTGIGIPPEEISRVLLPFGQVDSELSRRHQGTGLGLPLAKRLVELHGGQLTLSSQVGEGTRVTVTFPTNTHRELTVVP